MVSVHPRESAAADVRALLDAMAAGVMPSRERMTGVLEGALAVLAYEPPPRDPAPELLRALALMVGDPRIVSTGDLGRSLDGMLNTERACSLGGNRMRQMLARGWVVRERFARWAVTPEGRAEHERRAGAAPASDVAPG